MAVMSMSTQEFGRLEVLLGVLSGRLRIADASRLIGVCRRQVLRLLRRLRQDGATSLISKRRGAAEQQSSADGGSRAGGVAGARALRRFRPNAGGGETC
jgi:hypothetical protein